ncbi:MAG: hypothetical protein QUS14_01320, partial [Pyrinomonadaceae bacterium]|nr:hypothetical protein [Pyrinomonadaceae bacterium]
AAADTPVFTEYRGIKIGMTMDEVRAKLGGPKEKYDSEDDFEISANETARVVYGPDKKVTAISIMYTGDLAAAPAPKAVMGEAIEPRDDGGMYKMVQYPKQGFWLSYSKTAGDTPMIVVMMQKLPTEQ